MEDCLSRSHRNYRIAECCESCDERNEEFRRGLTEDEFIVVCTVDQGRTERWYTCARYKPEDDEILRS